MSHQSKVYIPSAIYTMPVMLCVDALSPGLMLRVDLFIFIVQQAGIFFVILSIWRHRGGWHLSFLSFLGNVSFFLFVFHKLRITQQPQSVYNSTYYLFKLHLSVGVSGKKIVSHWLKHSCNFVQFCFMFGININCFFKHFPCFS